MRTLVYSAIERLRAAGIEDARQITWWCVESAIGLDRLQILSAGLEQIEAADIDKFQKMIDRCASGEPVQYVCGHTEFYGYRIEVSPAVLIPRPETEILVDAVLAFANGLAELSVVDFGTGSGCIATALGHELSHAKIIAVDVNRESLNVAAINVKGLPVRLVHGDLFDSTTWTEIPTAINVVVSNPPYIPIGEKQDMSSTVVDFEPHEALFVDSDPLVFYRALVEAASFLLAVGGALIVEIHSSYGAEVVDLFRSAGFGAVELSQDLAGLDRVVTARQTDDSIVGKKY